MDRLAPPHPDPSLLDKAGTKRFCVMTQAGEQLLATCDEKFDREWKMARGITSRIRLAKGAGGVWGAIVREQQPPAKHLIPPVLL